ncbi:hypothetical protein QYE76_017513 [Lolium multiflorum]|uniref:Uncharacterized protein n=1 Tax=Lolium multiflorum TaxID=4521 RepID=A0AAD8QI99_LOLMU|nr:hypothetical protein QYE76_017513 [Lolium multiflorum]
MVARRQVAPRRPEMVARPLVCSLGVSSPISVAAARGGQANGQRTRVWTIEHHRRLPPGTRSINRIEIAKQDLDVPKQVNSEIHTGSSIVGTHGGAAEEPARDPPRSTWRATRRRSTWELLPAADVDEAAAAEVGAGEEHIPLCDPYMRPKMSRPLGQSSYTPPSSRAPPSPATARLPGGPLLPPGLAAGDLVRGITEWRTTASSRPPFTGSSPRSNPTCGVPLSYYTGILGMPSLTAYVGFHHICSPKAGEAVFVSAARRRGPAGGAVREARGVPRRQQRGSRTATSPALKQRFPEGDIDVYFENVGGKMLEADAAQHEDARPHRRVRGSSRRFIEPDHKHVYPEYEAWVVPHIREGRVVYVEDVAEGLEAAPKALIGLFHGRNVGKRVVSIIHHRLS